MTKDSHFTVFGILKRTNVEEDEEEEEKEKVGSFKFPRA